MPGLDPHFQSLSMGEKHSAVSSHSDLSSLYSFELMMSDPPQSAPTGQPELYSS